MNKYNYFYNGTVITKAQFLKSIPDNWESKINEGVYSWGYYKAIKIEVEK